MCRSSRWHSVRSTSSLADIGTQGHRGNVERQSDWIGARVRGSSWWQKRRMDGCMDGADGGGGRTMQSCQVCDLSCECLWSPPGHAARPSSHPLTHHVLVQPLVPGSALHCTQFFFVPFLLSFLNVFMYLCIYLFREGGGGGICDLIVCLSVAL